MGTDVIQAHYDVLKDIAARFVQQAACVHDQRVLLNTKLRDLEAGAWQGRGSQAFFSEMHTIVLPAVSRLYAALTEAGRVTTDIVRILREAEEEAASPFHASHAENGAVVSRATDPVTVAPESGSMSGRVPRGASDRPSTARITQPSGSVVGANQHDGGASPPSQSGRTAESRQDPPPIQSTTGLGNIAMQFTEHYEGRRQYVYRDTLDIPTVGVGFNLTRPDARQKLEAVGAKYDDVLAGRVPLTQPQIDALFQSDMQGAIASARQLVNNFDQLPGEAQQIVADMVFNLGPSRFAGFKNTIRALEQFDYARAATAMQDSVWFGQVGRRSREHVATLQSLVNK